MFLCLKIGFRQGLVDSGQPGIRVLSNKRLENFLSHGILSDHWQKRHSAVIEPADRIQGISDAAFLHR
ncbi:hypothetical protein [Rhizobium sp. WYJ-E13]|uniref:hypothetical protein n=1 Tax=Rhizobium sp. WYJ-E13 TaxID=2849093 RepID=UPI001C1EC959|nr:hypothetical protein [Rhizobium sp. WYJ-E13]QWW67699.1 hypothetical protein KQ933_19195 [Rhizobium sp. WYJ-E13]